MTLDALSLLHPAGPGEARPAHRARPGDDLVLVDGCLLQHPEFLGTWDLVVFARSDPRDPGLLRPAGRHLGGAVPRRRPGLCGRGGRAALAARHGRRPRDDDLMARGPLGHQLRSTGWRLAGYDDGPDRFLAVAERAR